MAFFLSNPKYPKFFNLIFAIFFSGSNPSLIPEIIQQRGEIFDWIWELKTWLVVENANENTADYQFFWQGAKFELGKKLEI